MPRPTDRKTTLVKDASFPFPGLTEPPEPGDMLSSEGFRAVVSSSAVDSYGDKVLLDNIYWTYLYKGVSLPVLFGHNTSVVVGKAQDFVVTRGLLECTIIIAAEETSDEVDMVRSLVEQGMLNGLSLGFMVEKSTPINSKEPYGGQLLEGITPIEISLTPTPANPDARIKASGVFATKVQEALSASGMYRRSAYAQLHDASPPRASGASTPIPTSPSLRNVTMTLAEKILAKQAEILSFRDQIASITNDISTDGALSDAQTEALDELGAKLEKATGHLHTMEATEAVLARAAGGVATPAAQTPTDTGAPRIHVRDNKPKGYRAFATIASVLKGFALRQDPGQIAKDTYRDSPEIEMLVRAATAPATTAGVTWATELMRETWGEMIALLRDVSVYGQVPGMRVDFANTLNLPVQNGRGALAAGFVAENGAIPVKEGSIGTTSLSPKKLGVISAYSKELGRRSVPSIQQVIQTQVLADTAEGLDTLFLDATARSTTRPAGLRDTTETGAGNINAATNVATGAHGATVKEILADVDALLGRAEAIKASGGAWLMNPAQVRGLRNKQDATTGQFVFRDSIDAGRFEGLPIISSTNVTAGITVYVAADSMGFGSELMPYFEQSDQATLHFEGASPLAIGTAGTPNTVAAPTISLFQQDLVAIKSIWTLDWRILRKAGIQVLTGTTAW